MQDVESIEALQRQLAVHRRTLEVLEIQRAQFGAFTPPYIWHQFDETRNDIARVKHELREQGVEVSDHPGDTATSAGMPSSPAPDHTALLRAYQHMLVDQLRFLPLAGMSEWGDQFRELAAIYVERTLSALAVPSADLPALQSEMSVFAHASKPGARIIIQGEPGSGKTTSLHALGLACAAKATGDTASAALANAWSQSPPLPISLSGSNIAAALARTNAAPDEQSLPSLSAFWGAIEAWLQYSNLSELVPTIQAMLEHGECIILIDNIDTLPRNANEYAYMLALGRFVARYPLNRYVLTCTTFRPLPMAPLASFARYALAPPDQAQTTALIQRWYASVADRTGLLMPEYADERIGQLQALLLGDERLQAFTRTPLTVALSVLVDAEGRRLPDNRNLVLERLADLFLSGWQTGQPEAARRMEQALGLARWPTLDERLALVEPLALALQAQAQPNPDHEPALMLSEIESLVGGELRKHQKQAEPGALASLNLLEWCCHNSLLMQTSSGMYTMPNVQLREYLAGRALAGQADFPTRAYEHRNTPHWRETLLYAVRVLERRGNPPIARLFVRLLLHPPGNEPPGPAAVLLAAACLLELRDIPWANRALRDEVRERLVACAANPDLSIPERIDAGLLLGKLGDPRLAQIMPALATIPAGSFLVGTAEGYDDERPVHEVTLPQYAIGIYPVTNQEFARFLAETPMQRRPRHWHDPRFNNPACPVVSVSWHDAVAYCEWLSRRLQNAGLLPKGHVARLPTEEEWEKAACWDPKLHSKRVFPWGDSWASSYANTAEGRGKWATSPVGCYPHSASPYGLHECVGNVWEWMASEYASYPAAPRSFHEPGVYSLRGSSHATNPTHARCTYRSRLPSTSWRNHLGFRVVVGPPLP